MLQYEVLKQMCKHMPYRAIIMHGKVMHWRCKCGRIVPSPESMLNGKGIAVTAGREGPVEGLGSGTSGAALHGRSPDVVRSKSTRVRPPAY